STGVESVAEQLVVAELLGHRNGLLHEFAAFPYTPSERLKPGDLRCHDELLPRRREFADRVRGTVEVHERSLLVPVLPDALAPQQLGLCGRRRIRVPKLLDRAGELVLALPSNERERAPVP